MHPLAHLSYPFLIANILFWLAGSRMTVGIGLLVMVCSILPDFDYAFDYARQKLSGRKSYKIPLYHHVWPSHWPIVYVPLAVLAIGTGNQILLIATAAIYFHLFMDLFYCNTGIMILYPFSKKWTILLSEKTYHKPEMQWIRQYQKLGIYKLDKVAFTAMLGVMTYKIF